MNKGDLIFDWSNVEAHRGWKGAAVLIVVIGFGLVFSLLSIRFDFTRVSTEKSAAVLFLPDHEEGKIWGMKAEEEGPFPGGLEISGDYDPLVDLGVGSLTDEDSWNPYHIKMRPLQMDSMISTERISAKGQRVLPRIFNSTDGVKKQSPDHLALTPVLIAYTKESEKWLPSEYPPFEIKAEDKIRSTEWRFLLNLKPDGTVKECLSMSGGNEENLTKMTGWLKDLRFQGSETEERWMGLRIEFLNKRIHGTEPK